MKNSVSLAEYLKLESRLNEIKKRILNGGLSMTDALTVTQGLLIGIYPTPPSPDWYVVPQLQIQRMELFLKKVGGEVSSWTIPPIPDFVPHTPAEMLVLAVYLPGVGKESAVARTIRLLWNEIIPPNSGVRPYTMDEWNSVEKTLSKDIDLIPEIKHQPGLQWVALNPKANYNRPAKDCWQDAGMASRLAGPEILAAAMLFPDWMGNWHGNNLPSPTMAAYRTKTNEGWKALHAFKYIFDDRTVKLVNWSSDDLTSTSTSCPTVRPL